MHRDSLHPQVNNDLWRYGGISALSVRTGDTRSTSVGELLTATIGEDPPSADAL